MQYMLTMQVEAPEGKCLKSILKGMGKAPKYPKSAAIHAAAIGGVGGAGFKVITAKVVGQK